MAAIYSTKDGHTITEGLQPASACSEALLVARLTAIRLNETVILDDSDGEWLVGPRGGIRRFTKSLRRRYGFPAEEEHGDSQAS